MPRQGDDFQSDIETDWQRPNHHIEGSQETHVHPALEYQAVQCRRLASRRAISSWVEMDTVIGRPGGKTTMTFDFTCCNFTFWLLLDDKTAAEASSKTSSLKSRGIGRLAFRGCHPLAFDRQRGRILKCRSF